MGTTREVSLFLKYPGPAHALHRLRQSYLECIVEYKTGSDAELQTRLPGEPYQMKGTATLTDDDDILVVFTAKHSGVHSVRIFADTRELCKPVCFVVNQRGDVVNLPPDRPVKRPPETHHGVGRPPATTTYYGLNNPRFPSSPPPASVDLSPTRLRQNVGVNVPTTSVQTTEPFRGQISPNLQRQEVQQHSFVPDPDPPSVLDERHYSPQRTSYVARCEGTKSRPLSMSVADTKPDETTFDDLYASKVAGQRVYGTRRGPLTIDYQSVVTPETLRMLNKEANLHLKGGKAKKR